MTAATTQLSVDDYLQTSFEPDADFLEGEIVERNAGEYPHSKAQRQLLSLFDRLAEKVPFHPAAELRRQVAARRYRVADLAVFTGDEFSEDVPSRPPLVAVEIVSRSDRYVYILDKLEGYHRWGVPHVWPVAHLVPVDLHVLGFTRGRHDIRTAVPVEVGRGPRGRIFPPWRLRPPLQEL